MALCYFLAILSISSCLCEVQGRISNFKKSQDVIDLTKSNFASIVSSEDDAFDCVDIYKQPAFNHPLLKNHKIQLFPNFSKNLIKSIESSKGGFPGKFILPSKGCPSGMVPIQRTKAKYGHQFSVQFPSQHFATLNTNPIPGTAHGASAIMNLWNPIVTNDQFSMAVVRIKNGPPTELNIIQAGWAVHSDLYGDHLTHMTVRWTIDGFKSTGCYNAQCPGFVQVHQTVSPGLPFEKTSVSGAEQYLIGVEIKQEQASGHWWLIANGDISVGYWPNRIFTHLKEDISEISFGGIAKASSGGQSPPMGAGRKASDDYKTVGFFKEIKIVGPNGEVDLSNYDRFTFASNISCYNIIDFGNQHKDLGSTFAYGGPGGFGCDI